MAFPVVTAAELLGALRKSTAVGSCVTFHVFPEVAVTLLGFVAEGTAKLLFCYGCAGCIIRL